MPTVGSPGASSAEEIVLRARIRDELSQGLREINEETLRSAGYFKDARGRLRTLNGELVRASEITRIYGGELRRVERESRKAAEREALLARELKESKQQARANALAMGLMAREMGKAAGKAAKLTAAVLGLNAALRGTQGLVGGIAGVRGATKALILLFATLIPAAVPVFAVVTASILSMGSAMTSVVVALGVLALGFSGVGEAVSALASGDIDKINEAFANLAPAGQSFARALFDLKPALDLLRGTAQESLLPGVGQALQTLTQILPNLNALVAVFGGALGQVAQQFANAFTSQGFTDFLQFLTDNVGDLNAMADSFITLSGAVGDLFVAFYPLSAAIGGGALATSFQKFADFASGASGTLGQFLGYIEDALPTVGTFFNLFGSTLLELLEQLGQPGIIVLQALNGILTVLTALAPTVGALAQAIGVGLLGVVGALIPVIEQLGSILGDVLIAAATALADTLIALAPTIGQIAAFIGGQLLNAVQTLAPYLPKLGEAFLGVLTTLEPLLPLVVSLIPVLGDALLGIFVALTPALGQLLTVLGPTLAALITGLAPILPQIATSLGALLSAVEPLLPVIGESLLQIVQALVPLLPSLIDLATATTPLAISLLPLLVSVLTAISPLVTFAADQISRYLTPAIDTLSKSFEGLTYLFDKVTEFFKSGGLSKVGNLLLPGDPFSSGERRGVSGSFGDTATAHGSGNLATTSASHAAVMGSIGSGVSVSNALIGGGGRGRGSGDHQAGRALDLVGSRTGAYANAARAQGHYAAFHGSGAGRHLHVAFRKPMGDTGTSMAPAAFTTSNGVQPAAGSTVTVAVYGNIYADDFYQRVGEAVDEKNRLAQARRKN